MNCSFSSILKNKTIKNTFKRKSEASKANRPRKVYLFQSKMDYLLKRSKVLKTNLRRDLVTTVHTKSVQRVSRLDLRMSRGSISIDIELYANVTAEPSDVKIQIFVGLWCIVWCRWSRRSTSCSLNSSSSTLLRLSLLGPTTTTTDTNINTNLASQPQHPICHLFCIFTFLSFAQGGPICYKTPPFCSCKTISLQSE